MTSWINFAVTLSLGVSLLSAAAQASAPPTVGRLRGHVESMGRPVAGADVRVRGGEREIAHVHSDAAGNFFFTAVPEDFRITVASPGYVTQVVSQDFRTDSTMSVFILQPVEGELRRGPVAEVADRRPWIYGALVQGGNGLTSDRNDFHFLSVGGHAGKVLTGELGTGALRGNFEYGVELFPFWQSYTPKFQRANCYASPTAGATPVSPGLYCSAPFTTGGTFTGVSVTPIILRWNFTHGQRWMPWVQGAGGVLWTNHKYPAFGSSTLSLANDGPNTDASVWDFTPQFGVGAHYFVRPKRSLDFSANAVHISSASLGDKNPGVNASVQVSVGYSWWK